MRRKPIAFNNNRILREASINGSIRPFQLLIDLKTEGIPTLTELQKLRLPYKSYFDRKHNPNAIQFYKNEYL